MPTRFFVKIIWSRMKRRIVFAVVVTELFVQNTGTIGTETAIGSRTTVRGVGWKWRDREGNATINRWAIILSQYVHHMYRGLIFLEMKKILFHFVENITMVWCDPAWPWSVITYWIWGHERTAATKAQIHIALLQILIERRTISKKMWKKARCSGLLSRQPTTCSMIR